MDAELAAAKALIGSGRLAEACVKLRAITSTLPLWGRAWLLLGQAEHLAGRVDSAAQCFTHAGSTRCRDASQALTLAAAENRALSLARLLPRHALAWVCDAERASAWRLALDAAAVGCHGAAPLARVLCAGGTAAAAAVHAALALDAGAASATAVCGSHLVADLGAAACCEGEQLELVATLGDTALGFSALLFDWGNRLDTATLDAFRAARAASLAQAAVLPSRVIVRAAVVECPAAAALNAATDVSAGECSFQLPAFSALAARSTRPVQMQCASLGCWRRLTDPFTLLALDCVSGEFAEQSWVEAHSLSNGAGHCIVTWLETEGVDLLTAPASLSCRSQDLGSLGNIHAAQYATFAPRGQPWLLAAGDVLRLRGSVGAEGVVVELRHPHTREQAAPGALTIPDYHNSMLNDTQRNLAYAAGLAAEVAAFKARSADGETPPRVLDIGAGAGLLSLLAAAAGATDVVAVERDARLASACALDAEASGYGSAISVVATHSRDLDRASLGGGFDVIVSEIFGSDALSEGVLPTLGHAQQALLAPGGVILPRLLTIRAALAHSGALAAVLGVPLCDAPHALASRLRTAFCASLAPLRCSCHLPDVPGMTLLTSPAAFELDLNAQPLAQRGTLRASVEVTGIGGEADAVLYWFEAHMDDFHSVATGPEDGCKAHWPQTLCRLALPVWLAPGAMHLIRLDYGGDRTTLTLES